MSSSIVVKQLVTRKITSQNFQPFGQVIWASKDGDKYDKNNAQLTLENGVPRFYIMRLKNKGKKFTKITRHVKCTQCLGSLEGKEWLMAVAPPSVEEQPKLENLAAFKIPGNCFIKLEMGTWHAGPYFYQDSVDFYNLELSDTYDNDDFTYDFAKSYNLEFEIV